MLTVCPLAHNSHHHQLPLHIDCASLVRHRGPHHRHSFELRVQRRCFKLPGSRSSSLHLHPVLKRGSLKYPGSFNLHIFGRIKRGRQLCCKLCSKLRGYLLDLCCEHDWRPPGAGSDWLPGWLRPQAFWLIQRLHTGCPCRPCVFWVFRVFLWIYACPWCSSSRVLWILFRVCPGSWGSWGSSFWVVVFWICPGSWCTSIWLIILRIRSCSWCTWVLFILFWFCPCPRRPGYGLIQLRLGPRSRILRLLQHRLFPSSRRPSFRLLKLRIFPRRWCRCRWKLALCVHCQLYRSWLRGPNRSLLQWLF